jgi:hypothetical protein
MGIQASFQSVENDDQAMHNNFRSALPPVIISEFRPLPS